MQEPYFILEVDFYNPNTKEDSHFTKTLPSEKEAREWIGDYIKDSEKEIWWSIYEIKLVANGEVNINEGE